MGCAEGSHDAEDAMGRRGLWFQLSIPGPLFTGGRCHLSAPPQHPRGDGDRFSEAALTLLCVYPQQLPARVFPGGAEPFQPTPPECSLSAAPTPAASYPHHPGPQKPTELTAPAHPNIPPPYLSPPRASTTHREPGPGQGAWDGTASDAWEGYKEAEPSSKIQIERMFEVNTMVYWFLACSSLACDFQSAPPQPWVCSYIALLFTADLSVFPLWIHPLWIHPPDCEKKPRFW